MFRVIIPLFNFTTNGNTFTCTGDHLGYRYEMSVLEYALEGSHPNTIIPTLEFAELMKYACEEVQERLKNIHTERQPFNPAKCFLVLDYYLEAGNINEPSVIFTDASELSTLREYCLQVLRLHATKGAVCYSIYIFNSNRADKSFSSILSWVSDRSPSLLDNTSPPWKPSEFIEAEFEGCRKSLRVLLSENWKKDTQFRRVLKLAMAYHWYSLRAEQWEHAYMMLAIAFEAMFKSQQEDAEMAIDRLSRLLSNEKKKMGEYQTILRNSHKGYKKIRNAIAHGDESLDPNLVGEILEVFYGYVRKSIVELLHFNNPDITEASDYYTCLNSYLQRKFPES
jgi:hypothetical protein